MPNTLRARCVRKRVFRPSARKTHGPREKRREFCARIKINLANRTGLRARLMLHYTRANRAPRDDAGIAKRENVPDVTNRECFWNFRGMPVPGNLYLTMRRAAQGLIHSMRSHSAPPVHGGSPSANGYRRHLYLFYLFHDKTRSVQTPRFPETDCVPRYLITHTRGVDWQASICSR